MESVRPRLADGVDHAAGGPAILGRVVAGQHGKLLNRIHAQVAADYAAWPAVAIIIDAEPIEPVIVLRGPAPGDGQLRPKAPVPAHCAVLEGHLSFDGIDAGSESGQ